MLVRVVAYMEFDPEEIIREVSAEYEEEIADVTMDDILEYIDNNVSYLENRYRRNKWMASDGPSIEMFESVSYQEIEKVLRTMQLEE